MAEYVTNYLENIRDRYVNDEEIALRAAKRLLRTCMSVINIARVNVCVANFQEGLAYRRTGIHESTSTFRGTANSRSVERHYDRHRKSDNARCKQFFLNCVSGFS